ncbi:hypothetical protein D3C75_1014310 [compost metagenome]
MARGGRISIQVDFSEVQKNLVASVTRVDRGTKKATIAACEAIKARSLRLVPRDTSILAKSFYYKIHGRYRNFEAEIGYGGNGDPRNPRTGQRASEYMVAVHEDLQQPHKIGQAKFLEEAVRDYQSEFLTQAASVIRGEL